MASSGPRRVGDASKRLLDLTASVILLLILVPLMVAVAIATKLDSRGSIFYRCRRVGFGGRDFSMLKFRKMYDGASGPAVTVASDARFTRVGKFLARAKIDEVPQLWNVIKGEMSLVGPRPEDPEFVALRREDYAKILTVRPGITGLSQLAFAREADILRDDDRTNDYVTRLLPQKAALDQLYVDRRSFAMDLRILSWTVIAVLLRDDVAVHRATGELNRRRRVPVHAPAGVAAAGWEAE